MKNRGFRPGRAQRTTRSDAWIAARDTKLGEAKAGILIGCRNEAELNAALGAGQTVEEDIDKAS